MGRPKKQPQEPIAFNPELIQSYVNQLFTLENEIRTVREGIKDLKDQYKDQVDLKLVSSVIRLVKAQLKINVSDETSQQLQDVVMDKINMVVS